MLHYQYSYAALSVQGCCTFGARMMHFYWHYYSKVFTPFFLFVDRQYQRRIKSSFFILLQQDLSMRVWGWCEGKKLTLTLTLTLFIAVCQPVTVKSEGVRVKKQKKIFYYIVTWMERIRHHRLWDILSLQETTPSSMPRPSLHITFLLVYIINSSTLSTSGTKLLHYGNQSH